MKSFDCLNANIVYILKKKGWNVNGYDIFLAGKGYNIWHPKKVLQLYSNSYSANFNFLENYHIKYARNFFCERDISDTFLFEIIKSYYVLIKIDTNILRYDKFYGGIDNAGHYILLESMNKDYFNVLDNFVPSNIPHRSQGTLIRQECINSWKNYKFETILLEKGIERHFVNLICKDEEYFYESCRNYLNDDINTNVKILLNIATEFDYGHSAIVNMIDDYLCLINNENETLFEITKKFILQIRWGGYLGYLKYIESFFIDNPKLKPYEREWSTLAKKWDMRLLLLLHLAMKNDINKIIQLCKDMRDSVSKEYYILSLCIK